MAKTTTGATPPERTKPESAYEIYGPGWDVRPTRPALAPDDITALLEELGVPHTGSGKEITALCPYHEDNLGRPDTALGSFKINADTGLNRCYSCGGRGSFATFLTRVTDMSWDEATSLILKRGGTAVKKIKKRKPIELEEAVVNKATFHMFDRPPMDHPEIIRRKCSAESLDLYNVRWNAKREHWILPIYVDGDLYGWQVKTPKRVFGQPDDLPLGETFFGWPTYDGTGTLVVVESPLDAVRMHTAGVPNVVASLGTTVSDNQVRLMLGAPEIILAFDSDAPGRSATYDIIHGIRGPEHAACGPIIGRVPVWSVRYPEGAKDPGDLDDEQCRSLVTTRRIPAWKVKP